VVESLEVGRMTVPFAVGRKVLVRPWVEAGGGTGGLSAQAVQYRDGRAHAEAAATESSDE
jgi:hypothetical protein